MATKDLNVERLMGKMALSTDVMRSTPYGTLPQAAKGKMGKGDCTINHLVGVQDPNVLSGERWDHSLPSGESLTSYNFRRHNTANSFCLILGRSVTLHARTAHTSRIALLS